MSMNKIFTTTTLAALLAFGLIAGTTMAQTDDAAATKDAATSSGTMMGMKGHDKMGMHHGMKMDGKGMGCMGMDCMNMDGKKGCMDMMNKMSDEDRQKFMDETKALRKEMMSKRFDYKEMMRNPASTDQAKQQLEKEMETIHKQMQEKMQGFMKK